MPVLCFPRPRPVGNYTPAKSKNDSSAANTAGKINSTGNAGSVDNPNPTTADGECSNLCYNEGQLYHWKDTIFVRITSAVDVDLTCHWTSNREYTLNPQADMNMFQTYNITNRRVQNVDQKRMLLKQKSTKAAKFIKSRKRPLISH